MELWSLYESVKMIIIDVFGKSEQGDVAYVRALMYSAIVSFSTVVVFFVLQGIALYTMAKKRNFRYKWLAFVPFANVMLMGRLAGETTFFGQKIKRAGLFAMIAQIVVTVISCSYIISDIYLHQSGCIVYEAVNEGLETLRPHWNGGTRLERILYNYNYEIASLLNSIFSLVSKILLVMILSGLYRKYAPSGYVWMTILSFFVPFARCILLLVLRNRQPIDYNAYVRAKREEQMRRYQQYYGQNQNPYNGNPYNDNPYHQNPYGNNPQRPDQGEPFSEFDSGKKREDPFAEFSKDKANNRDENSDGFFD